MPRALDLQIFAGVVDGLARQQLAEDVQELGGVRVARVVIEEYAVAGKLLRIASGDEIDEKAAVADAIDRRRLPCEVGRRREARPQRGEKAQALGERRQRRGDDPRVLAMRADGDQRAAKSNRSAACAICLR